MLNKIHNTKLTAGMLSLVLGAGLAMMPMPSAHAQSQLDLYLSRPKDGLTPFKDTTVETFNELKTGNYTNNLVTSIGTYQLSKTSAINIQANNVYGAGTGNYMAIGAQSGTSGPVTLSFVNPQSYFGMTWCAGDKLNGLTFYNGDQAIGHYTTSTIMGLLSKSTVTTLDGGTYKSSSYFGQPQTGQNSGEPYAFLNFMMSGGTFTKVVFDNSGSTGTGFESDNHTIRTTAPDPLGSFVYGGRTTVYNDPAYSSMQSSADPLGIKITDKVKASGYDDSSKAFNKAELGKLQDAVAQCDKEHGILKTPVKVLQALNPDKIWLKTQADVRAYFVDSTPGSHNTLGFNVNEDGVKGSKAQLIFPDASSPANGTNVRTPVAPLLPGDFVDMGHFLAKDDLNFFNIDNGAKGGTNVTTTNAKLNGDGLSHAVAYAVPNSPYLLMGFQSTTNGQTSNVLYALNVGAGNVTALSGPEPGTWLILPAFLGILIIRPRRRQVA